MVLITAFSQLTNTARSGSIANGFLEIFMVIMMMMLFLRY
jgi:hypothetical protein